jgi:hypothetical protein
MNRAPAPPPGGDTPRSRPGLLTGPSLCAATLSLESARCAVPLYPTGSGAPVDFPLMTAFALFFTWLAWMRRGRLTIREAGLAIVLWVMEWMENDGAIAPGELSRMCGWLSWAEWCARRADPAAARRHLRTDLRRDRSAEALVARLVGCARVLMDAPPKPPRRKRTGGMPARVRRATAAAQSLCARRAPPIPAPP